MAYCAMYSHYNVFIFLAWATVCVLELPVSLLRCCKCTCGPIKL